MPTTIPTGMAGAIPGAIPGADPGADLGSIPGVESRGGATILVPSEWATRASAVPDPCDEPAIAVQTDRWVLCHF